jgi:hypothetical protein
MNIKKNIRLILLFFLISNYSKAQSVEYSVKAMFIEKIARLTEWPVNNNNDFFVITVLGKSPFNGELEKLSQKVKIKNKPIKIYYINDYKYISNCNVLFICNSEKNIIPEIINQYGNSGILFVADSQGFCKKGIHFNFYFDEDETLKYEVNPEAIKRAKLMVDLQLLNYGKIIK